MTSTLKAKDRIIVALDTSSEDDVKRLVGKLSGKVGYFKIGLELFCAFGPKIIRIIKNHESKVFFDGKFLDIPNTVSHAVSNVVKHKVDMLNVYMSGGKKMLQEARKSVVETATKNNLAPPKLLGVTLLTSITSDVLQNDLKVKAQLDEYVLHLATIAVNVKLDGIICSANEAKIVSEMKKNNKDFLIVTPGIRPLWARSDDQERIATPQYAIKNGATHIVIGRPVTSAKNPVDAVNKILDEIEGVKV